MDLMLLGVAGWAIAMAFVLALMGMTSNQEHAACEEEEALAGMAKPAPADMASGASRYDRSLRRHARRVIARHLPAKPIGVWRHRVGTAHR
jgi:hypothetical protein